MYKGDTSGRLGRCMVASRSRPARNIAGLRSPVCTDESISAGYFIYTNYIRARRLRAVMRAAVFSHEWLGCPFRGSAASVSSEGARCQDRYARSLDGCSVVTVTRVSRCVAGSSAGMLVVSIV